MNLEKARLEANLTQKELAMIVNVDRSTIAKWETGKANPRSDKLPLLAQTLNCTIEDLFDKDRCRSTTDYIIN